MNIWKVTGRVMDRAIDYFGALGSVILLLMMLMICAEVFMRNVFNRPITGVIELSEYGILFITFLMSIWLMKFDGHARIDLIISRLKPKTQAIANIVIYSLNALICISLITFGVRVTVNFFIRNIHETSLLMPPSWILLIIIPIGYFFILTQLIRAIGNYRNKYISASLVASTSFSEKAGGRSSERITSLK